MTEDSQTLLRIGDDGPLAAQARLPAQTRTRIGEPQRVQRKGRSGTPWRTRTDPERPRRLGRGAQRAAAGGPSASPREPGAGGEACGAMYHEIAKSTTHNDESGGSQHRERVAGLRPGTLLRGTVGSLCGSRRCTPSGTAYFPHISIAISNHTVISGLRRSRAAFVTDSESSSEV